MTASVRPRISPFSEGRDTVVTGGAGFIGSHLCDRLVARGERVTVIDDHSTGHPDNLRHLAGDPRLTLHVLDVADATPLSVPVLERASRVYNLACPASPAYFGRHPIRTLLASTLGIRRMLEAADVGGARLLQASTSEVYGVPQVHPQPESYWGHVNPYGPRACYDEGKRSAEALCHAYAAERGTEIRIGRIFNTYGPRLQPGDGRVVSNFIVQALRGEPLTVYGDGLQTRSFNYVDDTVDALLLLMDSNVSTPVNIGNATETTVLQLAELVLRLTGSRSSLDHRPVPIDDPHRRRPDLEKARTELGWQPRVTLADGLRRTIDHLRHGLEIGLRTVSLP